ncbi:PIN domain-containing protein [Hymenobacter sp.]|uniref:PIN domain-containing protein n=1 Tax=Hymenobacter sp. TaxID=1898978 RepID=UPI00286B9238|nr:PIN domain-containing protein [Hymenobacter sp.]
MPRRLLLDSNILIAASQGRVDMRAVVADYDDVLTSVVCEIEVLGFLFPSIEEEATARRAVAATDVVPVTADVAAYAIAYRKLRKVALPDAVILATARAQGADLLTENTADFRGLDPLVRVWSLADLPAYPPAPNAPA